MKKKLPKLFLVILAFGLFLRLFKLQELFYFAMDEAYVAFRGWGLFALKRPFLIGASSPLQFHLPPYFFYLSAFLLVPFNFNPAGWGVAGALIGLLTIYLIYRLTQKLFNQPTAFIASLLYAFSFTAVFFDRHYWPLNLNPFYTTLSLWLITRLSKKSFWPYLGLAVIMVMAFTSDPSNISLILTILSFYFFQRKQLNSRFSLKSLIAAGAIFLTPLILFDLRHQWENLSGITKLFENASRLQFSWPKLLDALLLAPRTLVRFWYSPQTSIADLHAYCVHLATSRQHDLPLVLVIGAFFLIVWFIRQAKTPLQKTISRLIYFYILGITVFAALGYSIFDHYLAGLLPVFAILTAVFINQLPKAFKYLTLGLFLAANLYQVSQAHNPYGLTQKQALINWANQSLQGQAFILDSVSKCQKENGLRYLFELTDHPPDRSFMDPYFAWLYRQPPPSTGPDKILLVSDKPLTETKPVIDQQTFGAMTAYILDNSTSSAELQTTSQSTD